MPPARLRFGAPLVPLVACALLGGCALFRPPPGPAERLAAASRRLAEAPSDSARRAIATDLLREAGLTPVAGDRYGYGADVVAGFVPGRTPLARDTLVVVAAGVDALAAVPLVEAGRLLTETAGRVGAEPGRTVLVALWRSGRTPEQGLADVLAFPLWPRGAIRSAYVAGVNGPDLPAEAAGVPVEALLSGGGPFAVVSRPDAIAARVLAAASAPLFTTPSDTTQVRTSPDE